MANQLKHNVKVGDTVYLPITTAGNGIYCTGKVIYLHRRSRIVNGKTIHYGRPTWGLVEFKVEPRGPFRRPKWEQPITMRECYDIAPDPRQVYLPLPVPVKPAHYKPKDEGAA